MTERSDEAKQAEQVAKLTAQIDRGATAELVLRELADAFKELEDQCFEAFRQSDMHDDVGRRSCRYYLRVLDDVRGRFQRFVRTGEDARKELVRLKDPHPLRRLINVR